MPDCGDKCGRVPDSTNVRERRILITVLVINASMFVAEFSAGVVSGSTALLADSLDMLADALVYALGLFALGRAGHWRARAALTSGWFQLLLGGGIVIEAVYRVSAGELPNAATMGWFGFLALIANATSFTLLTRYRDGDINLRATWVCSRNDMFGNIGVLAAAALVSGFQSHWPDILIGLFIASIVIRSAYSIIGEARAILSAVNGKD